MVATTETKRQVIPIESMRGAIIDKYTNGISFLSAATKINVTQAKLKLFAQTMFRSGSVTNTNGTKMTSSDVTKYFKNLNNYDNTIQRNSTLHFKNCIALYNYPKCGRKLKIKTKKNNKKYRIPKKWQIAKQVRQKIIMKNTQRNQ